MKAMIRSILSEALARLCLVVCIASTMPLGAFSDEGFPPIGLIEFYGLRTVSPQQIRDAIALKEGDAAPPGAAKDALERQLAQIAGVVRGGLEWVCCVEGKTILFVGIEEKGAPQLNFRPAPTNTLSLPPEAVKLSDRFEKAHDQAVLSGDSAEDLSQGHSLMANPACRAIQQEMIIYAAAHLNTLRAVLKESKDGHQRAVAAWILGYAPDKRVVVEDLLYAVQDADAVVRNNATRSLGAIAFLAERRPELGIQIPPGRFIEMLNSIDWSDRNKATFLLLYLTENRAADVLKQIRAGGLSALVEMARWKSNYGKPAFTLLGRIAGVNETDLEAAWKRGDREVVISKARTVP